MKRQWLKVLLAVLLVSGFGVQARAALFDVGPVQANGYPMWYQDSVQSWYGVGPTAGGLTLDLCLPAANPLCIGDPPGVGDPPLGVGLESFWWSGEAAVTTTLADGTPGLGLLVLGMEGAFLNEAVVDGDQMAFGRSRIRIDVPVAGTYTVTHPYGVEVYNVTQDLIDFPANGNRAINDDLNAVLVSSTRNRVGDHGCFAAPCDFNLALDSGIGPWLFWDSGLPVIDAAGTPGDNFFIGEPLVDHAVLGSPFGTNFFRIEGPPGANLDGNGNNVVETALFSVSGKVSTAGGTANTAPATVADAAATLADTAMDIDVIANDTFTDIPINPGSLTIVSPPAGGTAQKAVVNGQVLVTYTPNPGFTGEDSFTYMVQTFSGLAAPLAGTVAVTVEDLQVNRAELRPKLMKWRVAGTSTDVTANTIGIQVGPSSVSANLTGSQVVPPVTPSPGTGTASVTIDEAAQTIQFTLSQSGLLNTTSAHIHLGAPGDSGPVIFDLAGANFTSVSGTLTAADLQVQPLEGINSFADAVNAILSGETNVSVHTQANPAGAIRGQLGPARLLGSTAVQADGTWTLEGKSKAVPNTAGTVRIRSSNGVEVVDFPLKLK